MEIRGVKFRYAFDQSGVRNFDGRGYPYHRSYELMPGFSFEDSTFVAKTTTLLPRRGKAYNEPGNMPLREDQMTPVEFKPGCIAVTPRSFLKGAALNAVGLSGPGLSRLLEMGIWYRQSEPFQISLMTLETTREKRLAELTEMVRKLKPYLPFPKPFGVQLNISCPNVDHEEEVGAVVSETRESLVILRQLGDDVPLVPKIDARLPIPAAIEMAEDPNCDALCNSNTIAWKYVPDEVRRELFGTTVSPLEQYGGGGLSGARWLLEKVRLWIFDARLAGITKPIIAGGGILRARDVDYLAHVGASAIAVGSVAFLRPWRVQRIIDRANELGRYQAFYKVKLDRV